MADAQEEIYRIGDRRITFHLLNNKDPKMYWKVMKVENQTGNANIQEVDLILYESYHIFILQSCISFQQHFLWDN